MMLIIVIIFLIYGLLSPIYSYFIKPNLSNEKGFLVSWSLAPFLVSYVYSIQLYLTVILLLANILILYLILKNRTRYLWNGLLFLILSFIIELFYKIL
ncbi:hypothetical protein B6F84_11100 [Acidianus manzaensis]|uniref:Uncharacterized protein n=1 Tax=Acidianus manzaensis TaxID=282676 RepID=A0A1W6K1T1_9CREN|nr:hypothetical protein B6F84_11100 [Acidianus manzaensis]